MCTKQSGECIDNEADKAKKGCDPPKRFNGDRGGIGESVGFSFCSSVKLPNLPRKIPEMEIIIDKIPNLYYNITILLHD